MEEYQTAHKISRKPRTGDVMITENVDFAALLLSKPVLEGLSKCGFEKPSPIQLKSIPLGRCGLDLVVQAKSGTGKTCVFTVIALESLILPSNSIQVLVLAPTREIAVQIQQVITAVGCGIRKLQCHTFIGGTPLTEDKEKLRRCHIAVGTPGRLKQLIEEKLLRTDSIRLFVMDEADKLMEKSFQEQINWIYWTLPDNKQMLVLSATYPEDVAKLVTQYMRNPTLCRLNASDPALMGIHQYYQTVEFHPLPQKMFDVKLAALMKILSSVTFQQCLIFSNYQLRAQSLSDMLSAQGWPATFISGSQDQQHRLQAMEKLKKLHCRVLVTTDLTSRGIDAEHVNLVINLDVPYDHETYLHRIGRAGRFGTYGAAISLVAGGKEYADLKTVEQKCHTRIKILPDPMREDLLSQPPDEDMFTFVEELKLDQISNKSIQQDSMNSVQSRGKLESEQQDSMNSVRSRGKLESKQLDRHLGLENNASIFVQSDCNGKTEKDYINGDTSVGEVNPAIADIFDDKIAQNEDIGEDEIKLFKRNDLEKVLQEEKGVKVSNSGSDHIASKEQETQPYSLNTNEPVSRSKKNKRARNKPKNQAVGEDIYQNISTVSSNKFQSSLGVDDLGHNDESGKVESTANKEHFSKDQIDKKDSDKFNIYKVLTRNWSSASRKDVSFEVIAKDHDRFMNNPEKWEKTRGFGIQKTELTESVNVSGEELADGMAGLLQKLHVGPVEHGEDYHTAMESVLRREKTLTNNISKTLTSRKMNSDYTMDDVQSLLDSYENIAMDGSKIMTKPLTLMYSKLENEDDMSDGDEECSDSDVSEGVTSSTAISDSCSESDSDEELEAGFIHKGSAIQYCDQGAPPEENQIEPPGGGEPYYDEYDQSYLFYQEQDKKHQLAFDNDHGDSSYSKDEYITHYAQTNAVYKDEYSPANYQHEWEHDPFYVEEYLENDLAGDHLKDGHTSEHSEGKQYHKKQRKQKKISHSANRHEANSNTNSYWWYNNMAYSANQNGVGKQNIDLKPGSSGRNYVVDSGNEQETYKANEGYFPSFDWWNSYMAHNWMMQYQLTNQMQLCYQNYMTHYQWALYYENMLKNYKRHEKLSDSYKQQKEYIAQMSKWITKNKQV